MPAFLVELTAAAAAATKTAGADKVVVFAADATDAKDMAAASLNADSNSPWINASTATELVAPVDYLDFEFVLTVGNDGSVHTVQDKFSVTGVGSDTIDLLGTAMAAAVGVLLGGTTVTYTVGTQVFSIPADNNVGDATILAEIRFNGVAITGLTPVVNAEGAAAIIRTVTLPVDAVVAPRFWAANALNA